MLGSRLVSKGVRHDLLCCVEHNALRLHGMWGHPGASGSGLRRGLRPASCERTCDSVSAGAHAQSWGRDETRRDDGACQSKQRERGFGHCSSLLDYLRVTGLVLFGHPESGLLP